MTSNEFLHSILAMLYHQWAYDISVMSQGWMYWWLLIPAICYIWFCVIKWWFITLPIWLPIVVMINMIRRPKIKTNDRRFYNRK